MNKDLPSMVFISGLVAILLVLLDLSVSTDFPSGVSEVGLISLVFLGATGTPPRGRSLLRSDSDDPGPVDSDDEPGLVLAPRGIMSPAGKAARII